MTTTRTEPDHISTVGAGGSVALKEWGAVVHALLQGRQTVLLRKGGIHEKAFARPAEGGGFVLFPTVAHSHIERTRPEHHDLIAAGEADVAGDHVVIRAGITVVAVVDVRHPDGLPAIAGEHIWTDASVAEDRVAFRPTQALQVLVVQAIALPSPVQLRRDPAYSGCRSWIDVALPWAGDGRPVRDDEDLGVVTDRVRAAVT